MHQNSCSKTPNSQTRAQSGAQKWKTSQTRGIANMTNHCFGKTTLFKITGKKSFLPIPNLAKKGQREIVLNAGCQTCIFIV